MAIAAHLSRGGSKPLLLSDAMLSELLSPIDNPRGFHVASAGVAICGALLLPVAIFFYRQQPRHRHSLAHFGPIVFGLGPVTAIAILFSPAINDTHVFLAFATYILMTVGLLICYATEWLTRRRRGMPILFAVGSLTGVLAFLVYLAFSKRLYNVGLCEWILCGVLAAYTSGLAALLRDAKISHHS